MQSLNIEVGGISCRFDFDRDEICEGVATRYSAFLKDSKPDVVFETRIVDRLGEVSREAMAGLAPGLPQVEFLAEEIRFRRRDFAAELQWEKGRAALRLLPNLFTFDALFRIFYSLVTVRLGGMLLHAASLVRHGRGYVFTGVTESGKSEISAMAEGTIHLTDELTIIRPVDGSFQAFGTPFWGLFAKGGANLGAPIAKLYFLVRDRQTREVRVSRGSLVPRFQRNVLNFSQDPAHVAMIFRNIAEVVERVYVAELHCLPDPQIWPIVDAPLPH